METIRNVTVGKRQVKPQTPSHTRGVREGNIRSRTFKDPGQRPEGPLKAVATEHRSTGINPEARKPIDPRMPLLTPA